ncbi:MAG: PaaI family thioesterase [Actinomycetospora chiangmaiensis]|nr:PaaI family thioesterase [Actinomycetospora chiangmaiensis]
MPTDAALDTASSRRRVVEWSDPALVAKAGLDGLAFLRAMMTGEVPPPPLIAVLGIDLGSAEPGRVTMRMGPGAYLHNPLGSVHGGALASLLDSVMGCAVHATLPLGRGDTTLEITVNDLRTVPAASGTLTAAGEVVHAGRRQAVAEARLTGGAGRPRATASTTCLLIDLSPPAPDPVVAAWTRVS